MIQLCSMQLLAVVTLRDTPKLRHLMALTAVIYNRVMWNEQMHDNSYLVNQLDFFHKTWEIFIAAKAWESASTSSSCAAFWYLNLGQRLAELALISARMKGLTSDRCDRRFMKGILKLDIKWLLIIRGSRFWALMRVATLWDHFQWKGFIAVAHRSHHCLSHVQRLHWFSDRKVQVKGAGVVGPFSEVNDVGVSLSSICRLQWAYTPGSQHTPKWWI